MQTNRATFYMIQAVVFLGVFAIVGSIIFYFLTVDTDTTDYSYQTQVARLQASAQIQYNRYQSYEAICSEIGVPDNIRCNENTKGYALEIALHDGTYFCVDSNDVEIIRDFSIGDTAKCRE